MTHLRKHAKRYGLLFAAGFGIGLGLFLTACSSFEGNAGQVYEVVTVDVNGAKVPCIFASKGITRDWRGDLR